MKNIFSTVVATALFVASAVNAAVPTLQPITDAELAKNLGQAQIRQAIKSFGAKDKTPTRRAWITNDVKLNQFIYDSIHNANLNYIIVDLREAKYYNKLSIAGAANWPLEDNSTKMDALTKKMAEGDTTAVPEWIYHTLTRADIKNVVFYCQAGRNRSPAILKAYADMWAALNKKGVKLNKTQKVFLLNGGFETIEQGLKDKTGKLTFLQQPAPIPTVEVCHATVKTH